MLKIRLQRKGKKHLPIYNIVVANSKSPRDGKIIIKLGYYNPIKNIINININTTIKWLKNGAIPTNTVKYIIKKSKTY
ncbi:MAG: 30S ribosomal protein S16 [Flavobacteriales endosymbiont of Rhyzopertha dominica]|nr:MAG: 30S ribosomal protein S16 [Candidatus Shikimatogenerans bostrichidophilus]